MSQAIELSDDSSLSELLHTPSYNSDAGSKDDDGVSEDPRSPNGPGAHNWKIGQIINLPRLAFYLGADLSIPDATADDVEIEKFHKEVVEMKEMYWPALIVALYRDRMHVLPVHINPGEEEETFDSSNPFHIEIFDLRGPIHNGRGAAKDLASQGIAGNYFVLENTPDTKWNTGNPKLSGGPADLIYDAAVYLDQVVSVEYDFDMELIDAIDDRSKELLAKRYKPILCTITHLPVEEQAEEMKRVIEHRDQVEAAEKKRAEEVAEKKRKQAEKRQKAKEEREAKAKAEKEAEKEAEKPAESEENEGDKDEVDSDNEDQDGTEDVAKKPESESKSKSKSKTKAGVLRGRKLSNGNWECFHIASGHPDHGRNGPCNHKCCREGNITELKPARRREAEEARKAFEKNPPMKKSRSGVKKAKSTAEKAKRPVKKAKKEAVAVALSESADDSDDGKQAAGENEGRDDEDTDSEMPGVEEEEAPAPAPPATRKSSRSKPSTSRSTPRKSTKATTAPRKNSAPPPKTAASAKSGSGSGVRKASVPKSASRKSSRVTRGV